MSKFGGYAMAKYDFLFCLAWLTTKFFSWGVEIRYHVANFDTHQFCQENEFSPIQCAKFDTFQGFKKTRDANEALDASNASL
jgi:hypothetical protein